MKPEAVLTCVQVTAVLESAMDVGFRHDSDGLCQSSVEFCAGARLHPTLRTPIHNNPTDQSAGEQEQ